MRRSPGELVAAASAALMFLVAAVMLGVAAWKRDLRVLGEACVWVVLAIAHARIDVLSRDVRELRAKRAGSGPR